MEQRVIHVSTKSIIKVLAIVAAVYLFFVMWNIILLLFASLIFAALIDPFANILQKHKIPRAVAVLGIYIALFAIVTTALVIILPLIRNDVPQLIDNMSIFLSTLEQQPFFANLSLGGEGNIVTSFFAEIDTFLGRSNTLSGIFSTVSGLVTGVLSFVLVLVITFYMVVQEDPLRKILRSVVPDEYLGEVLSMLNDVQSTLAAWMRGQIILSVIVALFVYIGLTILGIEYAGVIALLAGLFEFVPYLGPILAAIPAMFFAFIQGGWTLLLLVLGLYIIVQQIENHVLVPKIMQHAVGLNPIVSIIAVIIGAQFGNVLGALIAIPVGASLSVLIKRLLSRKKIEQITHERNKTYDTSA